MFIRYNTTKERRKALVAAVSDITGEKAAYLGAPSFAFTVGAIHISRDGELNFSEGTAPEEVRALMAALAERGFVAVEADGLEGTLDKAQIDEPPATLAIEYPIEGFTETALFNLERLVSSKAALIRKALGAEGLPMERLEDRLRFPWLPADAPPAMVDACSKLVAALCDMAKIQRRVTALERPVENERYTMRCFLLRLGFIGKEHGPARKALLANLTGDGSFKGGKRDSRKASVAKAADGESPDLAGFSGDSSVELVIESAAHVGEYSRLVHGGLCAVPPSDCNYESYLRSATDGQLREAIAIMEASPHGNKGRIAACARELKNRGA